MDHYAKAYPIFSKIRGYRRFQHMLHSLNGFDKSEIAKQRMKIISRWRNKLKQGGGKLCALIPESTMPHKKRTPIRCKR